jgi:hypothetical protein
METLHADLIATVRSMARKGERPSAMLRAVIEQLGAETADGPLLVRLFSEAFCFAEGQGYKVFGWFPDGTGALKDTDLDLLLSESIRQTRAQWDCRDGARAV